MTTVWLDTNVILRYLRGQPKEQFERSRRLLARAAAGELRVHISAIVVAEVTALLVHTYDVPRSEAAQAMIELVSARGMRTDPDVVEALERTRDRKVDFVDAYTWLRCTEAEDELASFDKDYVGRLGGTIFTF